MNAEQTLTEAKLNKTHWGKRIIRAEKRGDFFKYERTDAFEWTTCACGFQDERIPRYKDGERGNDYEPKDAQLSRLGGNFYVAVLENKFLLAAKRLIRIEIRAAKILKELK